MTNTSNAVKATFGSIDQPSTLYTYKTDLDLAIGDFCVVKVKGELKFVQIAELNAQTDPNATFSYQWIVQRVDLKEYEAHMKAENQPTPTITGARQL